jgi:hypothetical protein
MRPLLIPLRFHESGRLAFLPPYVGHLLQFSSLHSGFVSIADSESAKPIRSDSVHAGIKTQPNPPLESAAEITTPEENRQLFQEKLALGMSKASCNFFVATLGKKK